MEVTHLLPDRVRSPNRNNGFVGGSFMVGENRAVENSDVPTSTLLTDLFVNRAEEIDQVEELIQEVRREGTGRAMHLLGERGSGKTWLMRYLHLVELQESPSEESVLSFYLDFSTDAEANSGYGINLPELPLNEDASEYRFDSYEDNEDALLDLMKKIADKLDILYFFDSMLPDLSQRLRAGIERKCSVEGKVVVLLLDDIYSRSESLLDLIEQHLLKPLLQLPVVILLSGRGSPFDWISTELRLYAETISLKSFNKATMGEQIQKYLEYLGKKGNGTRGVDNLDEIYRVSAGYPYASLYLADRLREGNTISDVLDKLVDCLFGFIGDEDQRREVIENVEALAILNPWEVTEDPKTRWGFRINAVRVFLNYYRQCKYGDEEKIDGSDAMDIFQELTTLRIVRWEQNIGYYIDEALRFPVVARMKAKEPKLWRCLHWEASKYFKDRYPEIANKHQAELSKLKDRSVVSTER